MVNIQEYLIGMHNKHIREPFNKYVKSITNSEAPEEQKLLNAIYDLEFFIEKATKCAKEFRETLNLEMQGNGVISFKGDNSTATLVKATQTAQIINADKIAELRPDLMVASEIRPDRTEIAKLLRKGEVIQGAVLSNGGPPVLKITAIKNKTNPYAKGVEENV
ncbi:hypothetical protein CIN_21380 [Commensalibacter intestini A911]|uniref:Uncharacterized protein n=1 Tax=Commensalibacter intestini A911 TaxID=1088868 RepID=G6F3E2_9PROT|nr:siphovirus Gp157 family protein [Commensalibacter intestini]EHD12940.1 hypothetical protein CIN_21380 [Commensalibacter intestini A911]